MKKSAQTPSGGSKGSGDPVQRAARAARIKQSLRDNLQRRKAKVRAKKADGKNESDV